MDISISSYNTSHAGNPAAYVTYTGIVTHTVTASLQNNGRITAMYP